MSDRIDELTAAPISEAENRAAQRQRDRWRQQVATRGGRALLWELLGICHYGLSPYAGNSEDTIFISGKQKVGEHVMTMINLIGLESFTLMSREAKEDYDNDNGINDDRRTRLIERGHPDHAE